MKKLLATACVLTALSAPATAAADEKVMMILDESGSMWGQIDGKAKIEIANDAIEGLLNDWKLGIQLGVMAYGHREKGSCTDIETIVPLGEVDAAAITKKISGLKPKGKTPIAASLKQAASELKSAEDKATVILVSDGLETCDADPCTVAKELNESGVDFKTHVVGFDLKDEELAQLKCIADNTGGMFIGAANAAELNEALGKVVQEATVAAPVEEKKPASDIIFEEPFDDDSSALEHFNIQNEDEEGYLIEDGTLILVSGNKADKPYHPNSFQLNDALPSEDWAASIIFRPEVGKSIAMGFELGDPTNEEKVKSLFAGVSTEYGGKVTGGIWYTRGEKKEESVKRVSGGYDQSWPGIVETLAGDDERFEMQLLRQKRDYAFRLRAIKKDGSAGEWKDLGNATVIKPFKQLRIVNYQHSATQKNTATYTLESVTLYNGTPE